MNTINTLKKIESPHNKNTENTKASTLVEEVFMLQEKFFTFPQEGISMLWLNDTSEKPVRGVRSNK